MIPTIGGLAILFVKGAAFLGVGSAAIVGSDWFSNFKYTPNKKGRVRDEQPAIKALREKIEDR